MRGRALGGRDLLEVEGEHLVRLRIGDVAVHARAADRHAFATRGSAEPRQGVVLDPAVENEARVEVQLERLRDRALEAREAVVPLPPGLRIPGATPRVSLCAAIARWIERAMVEVLRADVGPPAIRDLAVDEDDLAVIDMQVVDVDRVADLRGERGEARVLRLDHMVVVDVRVADLDPRLAHALAQRPHVERVVPHVRIVAHHLLLARGERVAHRDLRDVEQHAHLHARARSLHENVGHLLADGIAKEQEHRDVDVALRCAEVGQQHGQQPMAVDEQCCDVPELGHAPSSHGRARSAKPCVRGLAT